MAVSRASPVSSSSAPTRRHFNSLDGYRGLAFLLVFSRHYGLSSHLRTPLFRALLHIAETGWIGVDLFFALSGLLITGILLDTADHPRFFRNFMARRALRIFPLFYGVAGLLLALTPVLHLVWNRGHLLYLVYLGNVAYSLNSALGDVPPAVSIFHLWSLCVEEQFYLLWPGVIFLLLRWGRRSALLPICLALSVSSFFLRLFLIRLVPNGETWAYTMLPTHADALLFGAVAALLLRLRVPGQLQRPARWAFILAAAAVAWVLVAGGPDHDSHPMLLFGYPALAILFSSGLLLSLTPGSLANRLGNLRFLRFFGRYSYGMYIFHLLFWPLVSRLLSILQQITGSRIIGGVLYIATALGLTTAASVLSYELYEKRWLRLKSRFADVPASPVPAVAS